MKRISRKKKKYLLYVAIFILVISFLSVILLFLSNWEKHHGEFSSQLTQENSSTIQYNFQDYALKDDIETILVMGLDKFEESIDNSAYNNDQSADFIMLFVLDNANSSCTAIHVNRDTITEMNVLGLAGEKVGTVKKQIALAHTYGNGREISCRNTADAVSNLLFDIKINHYVSLTMDSVSILNDLVGGVEVTVLDDFSGIDNTLIKGETVNLLGEHALNYVRSRRGLDNSSNANRMIRQRQYLEALFSKAKHCANDDGNFVLKATLKMADYIVSDCSINQLQTLLNKISTYNFVEFCSIEGESVVGELYVEFYPDQDLLKKTIIDLFYKKKD